MTPAARIAAAIDVLDQVLAGKPTEQALTGWGRANRYAGSKDRAAVRDHVFDAVRNKRSYAHLGGAETGRGLMLGQVRHQGIDPATVFTGVAYAPDALGAHETPVAGDMSEPVAWNLPDWIAKLLRDERGDAAEGPAKLLADRAPVGLRVNTLKSTLEDVRNTLSENNIEASTSPWSETALRIDGPVRGLRNLAAFQDGWFEFQDVASQALVDEIPLKPGDRVFDYCAGGGGKTLALAARLGGPVGAYDANVERLKDLPVRAERAGATVKIEPANGLYDVVVCDVPCSGSGAWRRAPDGKWSLTERSLRELTKLQDDILDEAAQFVGPKGILVYATCSMFFDENERRVEAFLDRDPTWSFTFERRFEISGESDGFFTAHVQRA